MRFLISILALVCSSASAYTWQNVKLGGGGGFIPGIVFSPTTKGLAYARADIGGVYKLNSDDSWTPLQDYVNDTLWHEWGADAIATDPTDPSRLYILAGMYTNSWDPNNGVVLRTDNNGKSWSRTSLPFKVGGNMPGRGMGERLVIDPQNNKIIYLGARSGNGLWKSVDRGVSFQKVEAFTDTGTYVADPSDTSGYSSDINGLTAIVFDSTSKLIHGSSSVIYVGTADVNASTWVSRDAGVTWTAMAGQPKGVFPHKMKFSAAEKMLYISYNSDSGPYTAGTGSVQKVSRNGTFTDITPAWVAANGLSGTMGYGGLALDAQKPGTLMVAAMNLWWPDVQIFLSNNSGASWTTIWDFDNGNVKPFYTYDTDKAPWINASRQAGDTKVLGWMVESLEIDPFDSNHWLYGTGATIYGGHNLKSWPNVHVSSLADGVEETAVQNLITPPRVGVQLISAVSDVGSFVHRDLHTAPLDAAENPYWGTTTALDYAGLVPSRILRIGNSQLATSDDVGATWTLNNATGTGGTVAYAADASVIVWAQPTGNLLITNSSNWIIESLPTDVVVVADKVNPSCFYAGDTSSIYVSSNAGQTFTATAQITSYSTPKIKVNPAVAGDVWFSTDQGIFHSTNFGATFSKIPDVQIANDLAVGKGSVVFSFNTIGGVAALRKSKDQGASWVVISDEKHGFGSQGQNCLAASAETEGLVFVGTNGRGVFYGVP